MHIVHLTTMRDYYGGEVCLVNLAAGMAERGHRVTCVVRPDSKLRHELASRGLTVRLLPLVDWFEPVSVARLAHWLRCDAVDVLHTHMPRDWFIAAAASWGSNVRNVGTRHLLQSVRHSAIKRPFLRRFSTMIAVSDAVRQGLHAANLMPLERIVTVPNGIASASPAPPATSLRSRAGVAPDASVIGAVGRLCPEKGFATLLRAVARVRRAWPGLRVFILGDAAAGSAYPAQLQRLCRQLDLDDAVTFFGYVDGAAGMCGEFDVQVVSSRAEPFGLVTLEAMAQGRPVVATATGGSPEILRDGVEGFLVPPDDETALAERLTRLLSDRELCRRLGRNGRRRAQEEFGLDLMLDRVENLYRSAVAESHPKHQGGRPAAVERAPARVCSSATERVIPASRG